jgi:hypothetical protein
MMSDLDVDLVAMPLAPTPSFVRSPVESTRRALVGMTAWPLQPGLSDELKQMAHRLLMRLDDHRGDPWALSDSRVLILSADLERFTKRVAAERSA